MRRRRQALILLLLLAVACATVKPAGPADRVLVRAETLLNGSLSVYVKAITWYDTPGNSAKAGNAGRAMGQVRVRFPTAWQNLADGVEAYKKDRNSSELQRRINALKAVVSMIPPIRA